MKEYIQIDFISIAPYSDNPLKNHISDAIAYL